MPLLENYKSWKRVHNQPSEIFFYSYVIDMFSRKIFNIFLNIPLMLMQNTDKIKGDYKEEIIQEG